MKGAAMATDYDALRDSMKEECLGAAFSGYPFAMADVVDIESASDDELLSIADRLGVDASEFETDDDDDDWE